MAIINVYITFKDNCKEAFDFYKSVFGGEFQNVNTFAEMPQQEGMPPMPEETKNKIMHISLPISKETFLMGSDMVDWSPAITFGNNFTISVTAQNKEEADRIFNGLAEGGNITMPLENTFWGSYFGMLTDKFGINWMMSCEVK